ncbi:Putative serine esterase DUF676 [Metschnikowia aff. pulcherrima]|uniref:Serine esterase DUF676 n=1 Tax=Metschnikowia aff. pulcherrima TaxID=2163413 RepID=A0A4V1AES1_9ASCO|nr:Putative serine esterase DUF676 [Metschnikowia aff. pulcherrima]
MADYQSADSGVEDENVHLFLFIHGLWGNPSHMLTIEKAVKRSFAPISPEKVVTIKPSSFRFWKTYDGIQRCAENTIADLFYEIETLKLKNRCHVTKISIVGYSLGGLISRYVIGCLYELGFFEEVTPVFFSTFATPHVGVHFFKDAIFDKVANGMGKRLFGKTGFQLFLADSENLLLEMTNHDSCYVKGLRLFQKRIILANIKNDRTVPFYTSFITEYSPFDKLSSINVQYFQETPPAKVNNVTVWPKFVDLRRSVRITGGETRHRNIQEATSILRSNVLIRYTLLLFAALVLFPFYLPLIVCLSFYVSGYSILKVKLISGPDIVEHWASVRLSVYHGGSVDTEHAEKGYSRRKERKNLSRHESFKGDTSKMTENVMENMLAAEEHFANDSADVVKDESNEIDTQSRSGSDYITKNGESLPFDAPSLEESSGELDRPTSGKINEKKKSFTSKNYKDKNSIEIPIPDYDRAIRCHTKLLNWNHAEKVPLFDDEVRLPFSKLQQSIVKNLNGLDWIKIPIYHDLFNAHDSIVARRGDMRNPKGTCTVFFWASILRNHISEEISSVNSMTN